MRATISLPDDLIEDLIRETGAKNRTQAIVQAIEDYLKKRQIEKLLSLQGKIDIEDNWLELEALEIEALKKNVE